MFWFMVNGIATIIFSGIWMFSMMYRVGVLEKQVAKLLGGEK